MSSPAADGCAACAAAARARAAAADQLAALAAENDALAAEVLALRSQLAAATTTTGGGEAAAAREPEREPAAPAATADDDDVLTDGDGTFPAGVAAALTPHAGGGSAGGGSGGGANVLAAALVAGGRAVVSAGADRRLVVTLLGGSDAGSSGGGGGSSLTLPAPALALAVRPPQPGDELQQHQQLVAAALMDGSLALVPLLTAPVPAFVAPATGAHEPLLLPRLHAKYAAAAGWSPCGRFLATGGADGSLALLRVVIAAGSAAAPHRVAKLQQCYFRGPVEALAWAATPCGSDGDGGIDAVTLVVAVRGSPTLHYLTLLPGGGDGNADAGALGLAPGQWLPVLRHAGQEEEGAGTGSAAPVRLLLHRVPLSEDGDAGSMFAAPSEARVGLSGQRVLPLGQGPLSLATTTGGGVDMAPQPAPSGAPADSTEGGRYIPVGFAVTGLAVSPLDPAGSSGGRTLAVAADNGVVYLFRFGTNALRGRLVGHVVGTATVGGIGTSPTRIAWVPRSVAGHAAGDAAAVHHYLAATSERDFAVVIYSSSGKPLARLGLGQPLPGALLTADGDATRATRYGHNVRALQQQEDGIQTAGHSASIKDLVAGFVALGEDNAKPALVTCGFDKQVLVWT
jgi:hypothetical protein